jgi:MazG family protein
MSETPAPRPLEIPAPIGEPRADALRRLIAVVDRLRDPDGCPWDRKQTLETVVPHLVEEAHELVEAVEKRDDAHSLEEAGDVLMGIVLLARIAEQGGRFDLSAIADGVADKLVRRHSHVFGDVVAGDAAAAVANWEAVKRAEREGKSEDASALAGVPVALPALQRASRLAAKARAAGFRWDDAAGALAKLDEEVGELREACAEAEALAPGAPEAVGSARERLEHELGDVLIAAAFLGNYLGLDPERAARSALRRFEARFRAMELRLEGPIAGRPLGELLAHWEAVKAQGDV